MTPPRSGARLQCSVAACLAAILEIDVGDVPVPDERHPEPWTVWALRTFSGIAKPRRTGRVEAIAVSGLDARVPGRWRVEL